MEQEAIATASRLDFRDLALTSNREQFSREFDYCRETYEQLVEMDAINPTMSTMDVAIVIGANDVVNPAARGEIQPDLRDADPQCR